MKKSTRSIGSTLLLTATLFSLSGAMIAYNLVNSEQGETTPPFSQLVAPVEKGDAISVYAAALLESDETVAVFAKQSALEAAIADEGYELLPPIVTPE